MKLLLASGSPYRKSLLERLGLSFICRAPDIDETPHPGETARELSLRLSAAKTRALADQYPDHLIIASDQAAQLGNTILGKPGTHNKAIEQLQACNNQSVTFYTGLCLLNTQTGKQQLDCVPFTVLFRELGTGQIENYIKREEPLDCAGSFKCEALGISLFQKMEGDDPSSLAGLPLIRLTDMLIQEGIPLI